MKDLRKYKGIIPAFYACYDEEGNVSRERTEKFAEYLINKGIRGLYVCGSSGECIYQSKEERKKTLESVMKVAKGRITVIAHVGCNNTADSAELAAHAEKVGVDAIASIPPIYFHLPDYAIEDYWNEISAAAPNTDFIIYNIPQLAGVALSTSLYKKMRENPRVIGVKNSSMPVQDIQMFKEIGGENSVIFNGPDEQFVGGRVMGADAGIGGTYAVMPELYLAAEEEVQNGNLQRAQEIQYRIDRIIYAMCACYGNLYAVMKEILRAQGMDIGGVRKPLPDIIEDDRHQIEVCVKMIKEAIDSLNK
ncbi:dihydrodipicolinate synthase family protein [Suipraeoptans intestinalis]|uniref:dihydrodipicolinate synthase family protein n=1 Tax=Suipraeoptans intestinalis TaxID=2606628 RepID=UPI002A750593|nr:dihydrodipicolinate synthase family protein [Suipraeoptans intestinalis]MDY3122554.1 dihydrodipicolinate synthase family protein [Suipraeoptans intestinalis]